MNKQCSRCGEYKEIEQFSRDNKGANGRRSWCRGCVSEYRSLPHVKEANRRRRKTEQGKLLNREISRRHKQKHPEQVKAQNAIRSAKRRGDLPIAATQKCAGCGKDAHEYHHYRGYKEKHWLRVKPVCVLCHKKEHNALASWRGEE